MKMPDDMRRQLDAEKAKQIDPAKTYRTGDGRAVRIYATDGGGGMSIHGAVWHPTYGWMAQNWFRSGWHADNIPEYELFEATLADELTKQIPWEALRPEIKWVAMGNSGRWSGFRYKPETFTFGGPEGECKGWAQTRGPEYCGLCSCVRMPEVSGHRWRETLCKRPEDT